MLSSQQAAAVATLATSAVVNASRRPAGRANLLDASKGILNRQREEDERAALVDRYRTDIDHLETLRGALGVALAHEPRLLVHTLDVAERFGIDVVAEAQWVWLADLALSLPVPAGWVAATNAASGATYWHNEISNTSTWNHPVDEFIKSTLHMLRLLRDRR